MTDKYIIGIDLGGTKIASAIAELDGKIIKEATVPTEAEKGPEAVVQNIISLIGTLLIQADKNKDQIKSICIGVPGKVDPTTGIIHKAPNLSNFENINIKDEIQKTYNTDVIVDNDANVATIGEYKLGAGKGCNDMIFMTVSTGIGGGIVINGKLFNGRSNSAGEIGHIILEENGPQCGCGNKGCLEAMASGPAMAKRLISRIENDENTKKEAATLIGLADGDISSITSKTISQAAAKGDKLAINAVKEDAHIIGIGLVNLIHTLDPEKIVIGGGVAMIGDLLFDEIRKTVDEYCTMHKGSTPEIVPAKLGYDAGLIGAVALGV